MRYSLHSSTRERCLMPLSILDKRCLCCCLAFPPLCCCSTLVSKGIISLRFIQIFNYLLITGRLLESNYSILKLLIVRVNYSVIKQSLNLLNFNAAYSQSPRSVSKQHLNFPNFKTAYSPSFYVSKQYLSSLTLKLLIVRVSLCPQTVFKFNY